MKAKYLLPLLLLSPPLTALADQLIPAGSVIQCTVAEPKISSKTEKIGDPILCQLSHVELYGRNSFPYGSYLIGHFEAYRDPGHFVGKGWMELKFDRLVVQPDTVVPIDARVVAAPKYPVDDQGRIHGTGHAVRDTVEWLIPVLWPIDLINLPRRGPRPVLQPESRLTLKVMDDFGIPTPQENAVRTPALIARQTPDEPTYQGYNQQQAAPVQRGYAQEQQSYAPPPPPPSYYPPPAQQAYAPQPPAYGYAPQPSVIVVQAPQPVVMQSAPQTIVVQQSPVMYAPPPPPRTVVVPYGYPYGAHYIVPGYRGYYGPY